MPAVTFDLWYTLLYLTPGEGESYYRSQLEAAVATLEESERIPDGPTLAHDPMASVFAQVLESAVASAHKGLSVTPAQQIQSAGVAVGRRPRPERYLQRLGDLVASQPFRLAPGCREMLRGLREDGYRIGIVSNTVGETGAMLRPHLRSLGIGEYFDAMVFSDEHPWSKPAPDPYWWTVEKLGERPETTVHVGDSSSDVDGGRRAGLRGTILFTGLHSEYGSSYRGLHASPTAGSAVADRVVEHLDEVRPLIHDLLPA